MQEMLLSSPFKKPKFKLVALKDAPVAASHQTVCILSGKIYVAGGLNASAVSTTNFTAYDIATDTWATLAALPLAARSASMGGNNGKVVHIGAFNQGPNTLSGSVYIYTASSNTWALSSNSQPTPRYEMAYDTLANGMHYSVGGYNGTLQSVNHSVNLTQSTTPFTSLTSAPSGVRGAGALYDGSRYMYVAGGLTAAAALVKSFLRYDITNNSWATLADLPVNCSYVHLILWSSKIYALITNADGAYANQLYVYDIATNAWSFVETVTGEIHALTKSVVYNNELYLIGGWNGSARHLKVSKLERYF